MIAIFFPIGADIVRLIPYVPIRVKYLKLVLEEVLKPSFICVFKTHGNNFMLLTDVLNIKIACG